MTVPNEQAHHWFYSQVLTLISSPSASLAHKLIWLMVGSILVTFNIGKLLDGDGKSFEMLGEIDSGNIWYVYICAWVSKLGWPWCSSHPVPFKCTITPCSQEAERVSCCTSPPRWQPNSPEKGILQIWLSFALCAILKWKSPLGILGPLEFIYMFSCLVALLNNIVA